MLIQVHQMSYFLFILFIFFHFITTKEKQVTCDISLKVICVGTEHDFHNLTTLFVYLSDNPTILSGGGYQILIRGGIYEEYVVYMKPSLSGTTTEVNEILPYSNEEVVIIKSSRVKYQEMYNEFCAVNDLEDCQKNLFYANSNYWRVYEGEVITYFSVKCLQNINGLYLGPFEVVSGCVSSAVIEISEIIDIGYVNITGVLFNVISGSVIYIQGFCKIDGFGDDIKVIVSGNVFRVKNGSNIIKLECVDSVLIEKNYFTNYGRSESFVTDFISVRNMVIQNNIFYSPLIPFCFHNVIGSFTYQNSYITIQNNYIENYLLEDDLTTIILFSVECFQVVGNYKYSNYFITLQSNLIKNSNHFNYVAYSENGTCLHYLYNNIYDGIFNIFIIDNFFDGEIELRNHYISSSSSIFRNNVFNELILIYEKGNKPSPYYHISKSYRVEKKVSSPDRDFDDFKRHKNEIDAGPFEFILCGERTNDEGACGFPKKGECTINGCIYYSNETDNMEEVLFILGLIFVAFLLVIVILLCFIVIIFTYFYFKKGWSIKVLFKRISSRLLLYNSTGQKIAIGMKVKKKLFNIKFHEVQLLERIGSGGGGAVIYRAKFNSDICAFKVFKKNVIESQCMFGEFERELTMISSLKHPNILDFYGVSISVRVGILMEYCKNGDLTGYMLKTPLSYEQKVVILLGVCNAMEFLHQKMVIHRDLKSQNILLSDNLEAKLIDFGLSRVINKKKYIELTKRIGTSFYMAPEITCGDRYDEKVDIFSFGIVLWEIFHECFTPYGLDANVLCNIEMKVSRDANFRPKINKDVVNGYLVDLMKRCWQHFPRARPTFKEIKRSFLGGSGVNIQIIDWI